MLDLSAAFDTINTDILLQRPQSRFLINGSLLRWIESYLRGRSLSVVVGAAGSTVKPIDCGVPQGSVLGPLLFNMYMVALGDIIRSNNISFHMYADDTQLYISAKPGASYANAMERMSNGLDSISAWMHHNHLKLNTAKTEFIVVGTRPQQLAKLDVRTVRFGDVDIESSSTVRNLGVILDETHSFDKHVNMVSSTAMYQLRRIASIRRYLTEHAARTLVQSLISTKIDYCNSLFIGMKAANLSKLQRIQNAAARVVKNIHPFSRQSISPVLKELHWLKVNERIKYKLATMMHNCVEGTAPESLMAKMPARCSNPLLNFKGHMALLMAL